MSQLMWEPITANYSLITFCAIKILGDSPQLLLYTNSFSNNVSGLGEFAGLIWFVGLSCFTYFFFFLLRMSYQPEENRDLGNEGES